MDVSQQNFLTNWLKNVKESEESINADPMPVPERAVLLVHVTAF